MTSAADDISKRSPRLSTVSLAVLVLVTFFTALYMKGLNSGIPLYYDSIGRSATVGGTFVAVFTLASTAMRLVGGQITDHFAHYRVLLASLAGLLVGVAVPALCDAFAVVMASRVLQGASFALATNVMTVAVMGSASVKHIGKRVGIKGAGTSLGTMLGALVSTWLLDGVGYQGFYAFYAAIIVVAIGAVLLLHRAERARGAGTGDAQDAGAPGAKATAQDAAHAPSASGDAVAVPTSDASGAKAQAADGVAATRRERLRALIAPYLIPEVAPFLAVSFARRLPKGFCIAFILVFARHVGIAAGAAFFVVAGGTTLLCRLCGGRLFDSDRTWLLLPLISVQIVGFALLAVAPSLTTLIVAAVGYGISVGTTSPFIKTLTAKSAPREHWGVVNGELYFFGDMGKAIGAFAGGLLIDATSKALVPEIALGFAVLTAALTAIALLVGHIMRGRSAKDA
ncbi:MAG: MFS transporter [Eggerthellaceae bacterium]|nr:MFS transporter [Eggerthellaceae bacterium]